MSRLSRSLPPERVEPDPRRFAPSHPDFVAACERHRRAVAQGADSYADPRTGYRVFTAAALWARGRCCDLGCRHCPFRDGDG